MPPLRHSDEWQCPTCVANAVPTVPEKITNQPKAPKPKFPKAEKFPKPKASPAPGPARPQRDVRTHSPRYWGSDTDGFSDRDHEGDEQDLNNRLKGKHRAPSPTGAPGAPGYNQNGRRIHRRVSSATGQAPGASAGASVTKAGDEPWVNENYDLLREYDEYDDDDDELEPAEAEVPYGGILEGHEAEVGDRRPSNNDRRRWERARDIVEVSTTFSAVTLFALARR